jgi:PhnB protein
MTQLNPYLTFNGNCAEAMRFYEKVLNGRLEALLTNAQTPVADQVPPGNEDRIMHAYLTFDGVALMAGDSLAGQPYHGMKGFHVTLSYPTVERAKEVFDALSEGATVIMPFEKTFWAEGFGMLVDRYGTPWIVNGALTPMS